MPRREKPADTPDLIQAIGVQLTCLTTLLGDAVFGNPEAFKRAVRDAAPKSQ